jgi:chemotaxis protein methyltransferase CheR
MSQYSPADGQQRSDGFKSLPMVNGGVVLSTKQFKFFQQLVSDFAGIDLLPTKQSMVQRRLSARLAALGLTSFDDYATYLTSRQASVERVCFVNALTTNKTDFFREAHHFEYLKRWFSEREGAKSNTSPLRMWSAGCSTGQEAYSMAMTAAEVLDTYQFEKLRILATDIDTQVLRFARDGIYEEKDLGSIPPSLLRRYMKPAANSTSCHVAENCKSRITFNNLNLNGPWPITQQFEVIFCRNVIIYFSKETQARLFERLADHLNPEGRLFLGHSESIFRISDRFVHIGQNIYRKVM